MPLHGPFTRRITREILEELFVKEKLKMEDIANKFGCSITTISTKIKFYGLKPPTSSKYIGQIFGNLTVKEYAGKNKYRTQYNCQCVCGRFIIVDSCSLKTGNTESCGCTARKKGKTHPYYRGYEDIQMSKWTAIKRGAESRKFIFEITIEQAWNKYISQNKKCALTGLPLVFAPTRRTDKMGLTTASLDRIDSSKGYTIDNIQWVHKDVNFMKQNFKQDYFIEMCKLIAKHNSKGTTR